MRTSSPASDINVRLDSLTGLRWWAAFMVFLFHMRVFAPLPGPVAGIFDQGYLGVTFFFVLSGFVLTWSYRPQTSISTFYWRRFARIWPATMAALLFAIPVFYYLGFGQSTPEFELKPFDIGILFLSVVLIQGWWSNPVIFFSGNPAAWTLTFEAFFYALHPWISKLLTSWSKRGALFLAFGAISSMFVFRLALYIWPTSWLALVPGPVYRLPEFVLGMALAWAIRSGWRPRLHPILGVGSIAAVVLAIVVAVRIPALSPIAYFNNELFTAAVGCAIVSLSVAKLNGRSSIFDSKVQVKLGEWSFAFYLVHATVIYLMLRLLGPQEASWTNLAWMALVFAIDLLLAWLLHAFVERPAEKALRKWKDRRDAPRLETATPA